MSTARILIADDDPVICDVLKRLVVDMGHEVDCAHTAGDTVAAVEKEFFNVVLLDIGFPDCRDLTTLSTIREKSPLTDVIMVTADSDDLRKVSEAVRRGAFDYAPKPIRPDDIRIRLTRVLETQSLIRAHQHAVGELAKGSEFNDIIGETPGMRNLKKQARNLTAYDVPVLISGETGTGKELFARFLHFGSHRRDHAFVSINCASLPSELIESELFGHEKGAFTGASNYSAGAFQEARDGTILLDEIGDMSLRTQAALLRILETGEYRSVGGRIKTTNARVVCATNQLLKKLVEGKRFREDLYYRVDRIRLQIPPLRKRPDDIPLLAEHFLNLLNRKVGKNIRSLNPETIDCLLSHDWPGNVRELKNEIERAYIYASGDEITPGDISPSILTGWKRKTNIDADGKSIEEMEQLLRALRTTGGNVREAATILGMHRNTVHRWIKKFGLEDIIR